MGHIARIGERQMRKKTSGSKPKGAGLLGRHCRKCEDNIKMDAKTVGCKSGIDSSGS
jgi:hypothetical protein